MKLHLGCGKHILDGWVNCDAERHPKAVREPDIICNVQKVPLDDGVASEVLAVHILEHFYRWEVPEVLLEWNRLLRPGGKLVLEMPDIIKAARNLLDGGSAVEQMAMWPLYGDPGWKNPLMCHRWGWTFATLKPELERYGFVDIFENKPQWHGAKIHRDFRVEAIKR